MAGEVSGDSLGDEFKGYVFHIGGGNDKQGFPMKQGLLTSLDCLDFQICSNKNYIYGRLDSFRSELCYIIMSLVVLNEREDFLFSLAHSDIEPWI